MKYEYKVFSLVPHETMPWCLLRDGVIEEGTIELVEPGVAPQVQVSRWVHNKFQDRMSLQRAEYPSKDPVTRFIGPNSLTTWRNLIPTGEVIKSGEMELPVHKTTFELEIKLVKDGAYVCLKN